MSRSRGVIRAITVSSSSKRRAPLGGGTTGRKGKKHRKMGEKRHFEPVKRAEPRFPENPTNHSSSPARRRQKIAPLRHSSPPLRPSRPRRHLPTSFAHSVCLIPLPFFHIRPSLADTDATMSNTTIHQILFTFPDSFVFCLSLLRGIAAHNAPIPSPLLCGSATTTHFTRGLVKYPNGTISTLFPPPKHFPSHSFLSFPLFQPVLPVCRAKLPKPSLPHVLSPPHIEGASKVSLCKRLLSPPLLTRHNDIPATESPVPKSPVSESVTASGADTVFTHAASAVCRHHNDADQARTAAFAHLTCANAPLFPPRKHNSPAECARFCHYGLDCYYGRQT